MDQLTFDTAEFPAATRFDRWRAGIEDFALEELDRTLPFDGCSVVTGLGALLISESVLPPLRFTRTAAMIRANRRDHFTLTLMLDGSLRGLADGTPFDVGPGIPLLIDHSRPSEIIATRARSMVIVLPRNLLGAGQGAEAHGPLPASAETLLLTTYLAALSAALPALHPAAALPTARALCELLAACLPSATSRREARLLRSHALRARLLAHVEAHLEEPLSVDRLCADLAVSRSALYRAVEGDGGIAGLVRTARLEWVHRAISDRTETRTIQQITHAAGFSHDPQFSRVFHATFGYTAAELRRSATVPSPLPLASADAAVTFREAIERLAVGPNPS
jgi:AraC-like DNA-binding protein